MTNYTQYLIDIQQRINAISGHSPLGKGKATAISVGLDVATSTFSAKAQMRGELAKINLGSMIEATKPQTSEEYDAVINQFNNSLSMLDRANTNVRSVVSSVRERKNAYLMLQGAKANEELAHREINLIANAINSDALGTEASLENYFENVDPSIRSLDPFKREEETLRRLYPTMQLFKKATLQQSMNDIDRRARDENYDLQVALNPPLTEEIDQQNYNAAYGDASHEVLNSLQHQLFKKTYDVTRDARIKLANAKNNASYKGLGSEISKDYTKGILVAIEGATTMQDSQRIVDAKVREVPADIELDNEAIARAVASKPSAIEDGYEINQNVEQQEPVQPVDDATSVSKRPGATKLEMFQEKLFESQKHNFLNYIRKHPTLHPNRIYSAINKYFIYGDLSVDQEADLMFSAARIGNELIEEEKNNLIIAISEVFNKRPELFNDAKERDKVIALLSRPLKSLVKKLNSDMASWSNIREELSNIPKDFMLAARNIERSRIAREKEVTENVYTKIGEFLHLDEWAAFIKEFIGKPKEDAADKFTKKLKSDFDRNITADEILSQFDQLKEYSLIVDAKRSQLAFSDNPSDAAMVALNELEELAELYLDEISDDEREEAILASQKSATEVAWQKIDNSVELGDFFLQFRGLMTDDTKAAIVQRIKDLRVLEASGDSPAQKRQNKDMFVLANSGIPLDTLGDDEATQAMLLFHNKGIRFKRPEDVNKYKTLAPNNTVFHGMIDSYIDSFKVAEKNPALFAAQKGIPILPVQLDVGSGDVGLQLQQKIRNADIISSAHGGTKRVGILDEGELAGFKSFYENLPISSRDLIATPVIEGVLESINLDGAHIHSLIGKDDAAASWNRQYFANKSFIDNRSLPNDVTNSFANLIISHIRTTIGDEDYAINSSTYDRLSPVLAQCVQAKHTSRSTARRLAPPSEFSERLIAIKNILKDEMRDVKLGTHRLLLPNNLYTGAKIATKNSLLLDAFIKVGKRAQDGTISIENVPIKDKSPSNYRVMLVDVIEGIPDLSHGILEYRDPITGAFSVAHNSHTGEIIVVNFSGGG